MRYNTHLNSAVNVCCVIIAIPFAIFVALVPTPAEVSYDQSTHCVGGATAVRALLLTSPGWSTVRAKRKMVCIHFLSRHQRLKRPKHNQIVKCLYHCSRVFGFLKWFIVKSGRFAYRLEPYLLRAYFKV